MFACSRTPSPDPLPNEQPDDNTDPALPRKQSRDRHQRNEYSRDDSRSRSHRSRSTHRESHSGDRSQNGARQFPSIETSHCGRETRETRQQRPETASAPKAPRRVLVVKKANRHEKAVPSPKKISLLHRHRDRSSDHQPKEESRNIEIQDVSGDDDVTEIDAPLKRSRTFSGGELGSKRFVVQDVPDGLNQARGTLEHHRYGSDKERDETRLSKRVSSQANDQRKQQHNARTGARGEVQRSRTSSQVAKERATHRPSRAEARKPTERSRQHALRVRGSSNTGGTRPEAPRHEHKRAVSDDPTSGNEKHTLYEREPSLPKDAEHRFQPKTPPRPRMSEPTTSSKQNRSHSSETSSGSQRESKTPIPRDEQQRKSRRSVAMEYGGNPPQGRENSREDFALSTYEASENRSEVHHQRSTQEEAIRRHPKRIHDDEVKKNWRDHESQKGSRTEAGRAEHLRSANSLREDEKLPQVGSDSRTEQFLDICDPHNEKESENVRERQYRVDERSSLQSGHSGTKRSGNIFPPLLELHQSPGIQYFHQVPPTYPSLQSSVLLDAATRANLLNTLRAFTPTFSPVPTESLPISLHEISDTPPKVTQPESLQKRASQETVSLTPVELKNSSSEKKNKKQAPPELAYAMGIWVKSALQELVGDFIEQTALVDNSRLSMLRVAAVDPTLRLDYDSFNHYNVLVVGDTDLAFSFALLNRIGAMSGDNLFYSTTAGPRDIFQAKSRLARTHLDYLMGSGVRMIHEVDPRILAESLASAKIHVSFGRLVVLPQSCEAVSGVLHFAKSNLHDKGEIHFQLYVHQTRSWKLLELIQEFGYAVQRLSAEGSVWVPSTDGEHMEVLVLTRRPKLSVPLVVRYRHKLACELHQAQLYPYGVAVHFTSVEKALECFVKIYSAQNPNSLSKLMVVGFGQDRCQAPHKYFSANEKPAALTFHFAPGGAPTPHTLCNVLSSTKLCGPLQSLELDNDSRWVVTFLREQDASPIEKWFIDRPKTKFGEQVCIAVSAGQPSRSRGVVGVSRCLLVQLASEQVRDQSMALFRQPWLEPLGSASHPSADVLRSTICTCQLQEMKQFFTQLISPSPRDLSDLKRKKLARIPSTGRESKDNAANCTSGSNSGRNGGNGCTGSGSCSRCRSTGGSIDTLPHFQPQGDSCSSVLQSAPPMAILPPLKRQRSKDLASSATAQQQSTKDKEQRISSPSSSRLSSSSSTDSSTPIVTPTGNSEPSPKSLPMSVAVIVPPITLPATDTSASQAITAVSPPVLAPLVLPVSTIGVSLLNSTSPLTPTPSSPELTLTPDIPTNTSSVTTTTDISLNTLTTLASALTEYMTSISPTPTTSSTTTITSTDTALTTADTTPMASSTTTTSLTPTITTPEAPSPTIDAMIATTITPSSPNPAITPTATATTTTTNSPISTSATNSSMSPIDLTTDALPSPDASPSANLPSSSDSPLVSELPLFTSECPPPCRLPKKGTVLEAAPENSTEIASSLELTSSLDLLQNLLGKDQDLRLLCTICGRSFHSRDEDCVDCGAPRPAGCIVRVSPAPALLQDSQVERLTREFGKLKRWRLDAANTQESAECGVVIEFEHPEGAVRMRMAAMELLEWCGEEIAVTPVPEFDDLPPPLEAMSEPSVAQVDPLPSPPLTELVVVDEQKTDVEEDPPILVKSEYNSESEQPEDYDDDEVMCIENFTLKHREPAIDLTEELSADIPKSRKEITGVGDSASASGSSSSGSSNTSSGGLSEESSCHSSSSSSGEDENIGLQYASFLPSFRRPASALGLRQFLEDLERNSASMSADGALAKDSYPEFAKPPPPPPTSSSQHAASEFLPTRRVPPPPLRNFETRVETSQSKTGDEDQSIEEALSLLANSGIVSQLTELFGDALADQTQSPTPFSHAPLSPLITQRSSQAIAQTPMETSTLTALTPHIPPHLSTHIPASTSPRRSSLSVRTSPTRTASQTSTAPSTHVPFLLPLPSQAFPPAPLIPRGQRPPPMASPQPFLGLTNTEVWASLPALKHLSVHEELPPTFPLMLPSIRLYSPLVLPSIGFRRPIYFSPSSKFHHGVSSPRSLQQESIHRQPEFPTGEFVDDYHSRHFHDDSDSRSFRRPLSRPYEQPLSHERPPLPQTFDRHTSSHSPERQMPFDRYSQSIERSPPQSFDRPSAEQHGPRQSYEKPRSLGRALPEHFNASRSMSETFESAPDLSEWNLLPPLPTHFAQASSFEQPPDREASAQEFSSSLSELPPQIVYLEPQATWQDMPPLEAPSQQPSPMATPSPSSAVSTTEQQPTSPFEAILPSTTTAADRPMFGFLQPQTCQHWLLGRCAYGALCAFTHSGTPLVTPLSMWNLGVNNTILPPGLALNSLSAASTPLVMAPSSLLSPFSTSWPLSSFDNPQLSLSSFDTPQPSLDTSTPALPAPPVPALNPADSPISETPDNTSLGQASWEGPPESTALPHRPLQIISSAPMLFPTPPNTQSKRSVDMVRMAKNLAKKAHDKAKLNR